MFALDAGFVASYKDKPNPLSPGLGDTIYRRTYSRLRDDGRNEEWFETVERVVNGAYRMQEQHCEYYKLPWLEDKAQASAQDMYNRIFNMKFLPPGRGLWAMGSKITEERQLYCALNNCAYVSTKDLAKDLAKPFCFLMDMSMLGAGVGFDSRGAGDITIHQPSEPTYRKDFTISHDGKGPYTYDWRQPDVGYTHFKITDDRKGWVLSVRLLLESYFVEGRSIVEFDYSDIRKKGTLIKGFGGKASGPGPLKDLHRSLREILDRNVGKPITLTTINDIMNLIGKAVVAGNVRRSAEISFGSPYQDEFLDLKNPELYPDELMSHRWAANNTVFCDLGMDYSEVGRRTSLNGEPGYSWLENMQAYSRMVDAPDYKDHRAMGGNPCLEQTLESYEMCCLVEVFPDRCDDLEDFQKTLKMSYLYAKSVTLGKSHWPETNSIMLRNRRIGNSMSGIIQFLANRGLHVFKEWCEAGYASIRRWDTTYSDWLAIPKSIKCTSVKPSGSVSKLAGATSGVHWPVGRYALVRATVAENHGVFKDLKAAGYTYEPSAYTKGSVVFHFPVDYGEGIRGEKEVSCWEKISLAAFLQKYWADNQVSATITFDPDTEASQIIPMLNYFQYQLKGVSMLPIGEAFEQMPYVAISEKKYLEMTSELKPIVWSFHEDTLAEKFCDNDGCELPSA